ncbi:putative peptidase [Microseira wollei NIES-4236]|uniref:Peptidase n=1 Tax=Microseira wollei NIES-4236 TaxID=2530354 RepID=A0AAV3XSI8_9CYAN|nr:putative peptidase [Microseira wollei NIES-4236]
MRLCKDNNILLVAAAGNDGCFCLHVPASLPAVLAVGAMDEQGNPIDFSNWGETYQNQGILAPGSNILGAQPGGGTVRLSGTSFATPIVSGVAALLLSLQVQQGVSPNPQKVRTALLQSALPCDAADTNSNRCLVGKLNILGALNLLTGETMSEELEAVTASGCGCGGTLASNQPEALPPAIRSQAEPGNEEMEALPLVEITASSLTASPEIVPAEATAPTIASTQTISTRPSIATTSTMSNRSSNYVTASQSDASTGGIVYALGTLGYDFGTEARRDTFKQLMPGVAVDNTTVPANPYDARQMVDYLAESLSEAKALIWTLNIELTPVYAIEPVGPFAREVYAVLQELLSGQIQAEDSADYVERVSIPGRLTGKTVKLFSGQVVPVIEPENTRGMYGWKVNNLVTAAIETVRATTEQVNEAGMQRTLDSFLNRIYYDLRNLGTTSQDRARGFCRDECVSSRFYLCFCGGARNGTR